MSGRATPPLELRPDGTGSRLRLRVSAGARGTRVVGVHGGALKLAVSAPPERGKANREVVRLVAETFGVDARAVGLASGERSPDKVVWLPIAPAEAAARWKALGRAPDSIPPHSGGRTGAS